MMGKLLQKKGDKGSAGYGEIEENFTLKSGKVFKKRLFQEIFKIKRAIAVRDVLRDGIGGMCESDLEEKFGFKIAHTLKGLFHEISESVLLLVNRMTFENLGVKPVTQDSSSSSPPPARQLVSAFEKNFCKKLFSYGSCVKVKNKHNQQNVFLTADHCASYSRGKNQRKKLTRCSKATTDDNGFKLNDATIVGMNDNKMAIEVNYEYLLVHHKGLLFADWSIDRFVVPKMSTVNLNEMSISNKEEAITEKGFKIDAQKTKSCNSQDLALIFTEEDMTDIEGIMVDVDVSEDQFKEGGVVIGHPGNFSTEDTALFLFHFPDVFMAFLWYLCFCSDQPNTFGEYNRREIMEIMKQEPQLFFRKCQEERQKFDENGGLYKIVAATALNKSIRSLFSNDKNVSAGNPLTSSFFDTEQLNKQPISISLEMENQQRPGEPGVNESVKKKHIIKNILGTFSSQLIEKVVVEKSVKPLCSVRDQKGIELDYLEIFQRMHHFVKEQNENGVQVELMKIQTKLYEIKGKQCLHDVPTTGGMSGGAYCSVMFEMVGKGGNMKVKCVKFSGIHVSFKCHKQGFVNSFVPFKEKSVMQFLQAEGIIDVQMETKSHKPKGNVMKKL